MSMNDAIVVDVGSGFIKAGLTDQPEPTLIFPSLVGKPRRRYEDKYPGSPCFTGMEAVQARKHLSFFYPIDHGHIEDWAMMDEVWNHAFQENHGMNPEMRPVLITQPPLASELHQQRMIETMFEIYSSSEVCLAVQGVLSLYAVGRTTGVAVEIGEGVTQVIPAVEGQAIREAVRRVDCGGQELTMYLQKLLCNNGHPLTTRDDFEYCRLIKEQYCYVALDPASEDLRNDLDMTYVFPDGFQLRDGSKEVTLGHERFYCPEPLFNPSLIDKDHAPLYDLIMESFQKSPIDLRTKLLENVVLAGGTSVFAGLRERLREDLLQVIPPAKQNILNVVADEMRLYAAWLGGKIFADLRESQRDSWVTIEDYREEGERVVQRFKGL